MYWSDRIPVRRPLAIRRYGRNQPSAVDFGCPSPWAILRRRASFSARGDKARKDNRNSRVGMRRRLVFPREDEVAPRLPAQGEGSTRQRLVRLYLIVVLEPIRFRPAQRWFNFRRWNTLHYRGLSKLIVLRHNNCYQPFLLFCRPRSFFEGHASSTSHRIIAHEGAGFD
ncbi:hypothetical protein B296_00030611 [Ensete ventricosum]|uniref:Uncharacterized protein n=1 Tax=Ensete ventricosum TaxID=4639 RepID=A0A426X8V2_ENSVE|nr:hypothetical protein B296_00030611 [Ensete ventricosum]